MKSPSKKLSAILLEIFIVIVGISIAFTLDNWSNDRKQQALERKYKASLIQDLEKDMTDLEAIIDSTQTIINYVGEIFEFSFANANDSVYRRHHITSTYLANYFYPQNGTYVSMVNSGAFSLIDEFEIRQALSDHYNVRLKELERMDEVVRNLADNMISPYMLENIQFDFQRDGIASATPLRSTKAINMIGSYYNLLSGRQQAYKKIMKESADLVKDIQNTL